MIDREEAFCLDTTISHLGGSHGPIRQVERGDQSGASKVLPTKNPNSGGDCGSHATPLQAEVRGSIPSTIPRKCCGSSDTTTVIRVSGDMSCSSALVAKHMFRGARCHLILARGESFTTTYKIFRETKFISKVQQRHKYFLRRSEGPLQKMASLKVLQQKFTPLCRIDIL